MDVNQDYISTDLNHILVDQDLIEALYEKEIISKEARVHALNQLYSYPYDQWGFWATRLFFILGISLITFGFIGIYATSEGAVSSFFNLIAPQLYVIGALSGAAYYSLETTRGRFLLMVASLMTGLCLLAFQQFYQVEGAMFQLFASWSLMILGWSVLSNFTFQWVLWLIIANIAFAIGLKDIGAVPAGAHFYFYIGMFNGILLVLRECGVTFLRANWLKAVPRLMLLALILFTLAVPVVEFIFCFADEQMILWKIPTFSVLCYIGLFAVYRYKFPDFRALVLIVLSGCLIFEVMIGWLLFQIFDGEAEQFFLYLLIMIIATSVVFTSATFYLRNIIKYIQPKP
jgi:hypothetical protein